MSSHKSAIHPHLEGAIGRSRALRSNWLWLPRLGVMIDAGDGCSVELGTRLGSPPVLAITHGHGDHILGLPALIAARQFGSMHSGGPLTILYPGNCPNITSMQRMIKNLWPWSDFDRIVWRPMRPGDLIPLGSKRHIQAFETIHSPDLPSLGYAVVETRNRLRPEMRGLPKERIILERKAKGDNAVVESYTHTLLAHTGDTTIVDTLLFENADVLVYDCTFLDAADRVGPTHASLPEVYELACRRKVGTLVLHHFSLRYERDELEKEIRGRIPTATPGPRVVLWDEDAFIPIRHDGVATPPEKEEQQEGELKTP